MTTKNDIEQLFRNNYAAMLTLAGRLMHDEDVARDIVHDVFAMLIANELTDVTLPYLLKAVRNRSLNHIRNLSVRDRLADTYAMDLDDTDCEDWPDEALIRLIHDITETDLSPQCRKIVEMRFERKMSYRELSVTLGISEVAVYKHLRHAIDVIREKLRDYE